MKTHTTQPRALLVTFTLALLLCPASSSSQSLSIAGVPIELGTPIDQAITSLRRAGLEADGMVGQYPINRFLGGTMVPVGNVNSDDGVVVSVSRNVVPPQEAGPEAFSAFFDALEESGVSDACTVSRDASGYSFARFRSIAFQCPDRPRLTLTLTQSLLDIVRIHESISR